MREEVEEEEELGVPVMSTTREPSHPRVGRGILGEGAEEGEEREGSGTWKKDSEGQSVKRGNGVCVLRERDDRRGRRVRGGRVRQKSKEGKIKRTVNSERKMRGESV